MMNRTLGVVAALLSVGLVSVGRGRSSAGRRRSRRARHEGRGTDLTT